MSSLPQTIGFYRQNAELYATESRRLVAAMAEDMRDWSGQADMEESYAQIRRQLVVVCDLALALNVALDCVQEGRLEERSGHQPFTDIPGPHADPIHLVYRAAARQYAALLADLDALRRDLY